MLAARNILIGMPIDDQTAQTAIAKLLYLQMLDSNAPIVLYINSPGGSITSSLAIVDTIMELHPPVYTVAMNHCHGSALLVLAVGQSGHRLALKDATLSIEATEPGPSVLSAEAEKNLSRLNNRMASIFSQHSKLTMEQSLEALKRGRLLSLHEAVTLGIIDGVAEAKTPGPD